MILGNKVLNSNEIKIIVDSAYRLLEKTGVVVENIEILDKFAEYGAVVNRYSFKVTFSRKFIEEFISESEKVSWEDRTISFSSAAEVYQGYYLDPRDDEFKEWTEERLLEYIKTARSLPHVDAITMLGCPIKEVPVMLQPLYEKLYCWKYGLSGGSAIWETGLCQKIYEMFETYAGETGKDIKDVYHCGVYLISPLKFGRVEAEQFMYFYKKGLATYVGALGSLGGTTPITPAGALSLQVAEYLFINILNRVFFGQKTLNLQNSLSVLDMSTGAFQYGRPEQILLNIAGLQVAQFLGAEFSGHCGLSDAKVPGYEAGVQKVSSAIFNATSCGKGHIVAGLLGVDEIFSPVQMILDNELTGSLKRICQGFKVNEYALGADLVEEVGHGGNFLDTEHTAMNFRSTIWMPEIWSKEMYNFWNNSGKKNEIDKAKDKFFSILNEEKTVESEISEYLEKKLIQIINKD